MFLHTCVVSRCVLLIHPLTPPHKKTQSTHSSALSHAAALPTFATPLLGPSLQRAVRAVVVQGMLPPSALGVKTKVNGASTEAEEEDDEFLEDDAEVRAVYGIINRNACERCGRRTGALVCCDACPAAYHEGCIPAEAPQPDLESDAPWTCPRCADKTDGADALASSGTEPLTLGAMLASVGGAGGPICSSGGLAGNSLIHRPRLLVHGPRGQGQALLGAALLHKLESLPVFPLDLPSLLSDAAFASPEQCLVTRITCVHAYQIKPIISTCLVNTSINSAWLCRPFLLDTHVCNQPTHTQHNHMYTQRGPPLRALRTLPASARPVVHRGGRRLLRGAP